MPLAPVLPKRTDAQMEDSVQSNAIYCHSEAMAAASRDDPQIVLTTDVTNRGKNLATDKAGQCACRSALVTA